MSSSVRFLASATAALALGAPAAHAMPASDTPSAPGGARAVAVSPSAGDGFDWGAAAIGGGGVAGLVVLLSAAATVAGRARVPSPR